MSIYKKYSCDLCNDPIADGGCTLIYEHDGSGAHDATISLLRCVEGMVDDHEHPKVVHLCKRCKGAISNPQPQKKS